MKYHWIRFMCTVLICISIIIFSGCTKEKESLEGTWQTKNGEIMVVTDKEFIIQGISFPYELCQTFKGKDEQGFTVIAGSLGAMEGSYHFENGLLYMTIEKSEEVFFRR